MCCDLNFQDFKTVTLYIFTELKKKAQVHGSNKTALALQVDYPIKNPRNTVNIIKT